MNVGHLSHEPGKYAGENENQQCLNCSMSPSGYRNICRIFFLKKKGYVVPEDQKQKTTSGTKPGHLFQIWNEELH